MALRVKISARAASQVRKAADWWAENRPAATGAIGAKYEGTRTPGVRRLFLSRVGYFIYYKAENDSLHVLAFWHASREHQPIL